MKLLVVEDEKDLADAIARGLTRQTYSVDISYDGTKALELAEINTYDLIILDLNLPEIDGLEVCRRIRAKDPKIGNTDVDCQGRTGRPGPGVGYWGG